MKNTNAFTLVELIVVVTILAILSTIGFVSYSGYLAGVRDTNRIAQLKAIGDALHLYSTNKSLPTPDDKIDITTNGSNIISYQGEVGKDVIETVGYTAEGLDPKDKTYFSYYLTKDKKYFQLMAFLEEEQGLTSKLKINTKANAEIDYETRYARVEGAKLGILTGTGGAPIHELVTTVDLSNSTGITSHLSNSEILTGTTLISIASDSSCKRLYEVGGKRISGLYTIYPSGDGIGTKVNCYMGDEKENLLQDNWSIGIGSDGNFLSSGYDDENERLIGISPFNINTILWKSQARSGETTGARGGFVHSDVNIDPNSIYRFSLWVKKNTNSTGIVYFGTQTVFLKEVSSAAETSNAYFYGGDLPEANKWYLLVGHVYPKNYSGGENGGVYDGVSFEKVGSTKDFININDGTNTRHRIYNYGNTDNTIIQYMYGAKIQKIEQSELGDIDDLLNSRHN